MACFEHYFISVAGSKNFRQSNKKQNYKIILIGKIRYMNSYFITEKINFL